MQDVVSAKHAIQTIKRRIDNCSDVDIYSFNVRPDELESAYASLERIRVKGRKALRVIYSDDCNFVIKYMPGAAYQSPVWTWTGGGLLPSLAGMTGSLSLTSTGLEMLGGTTFEPSPGKRLEADSSICPLPRNTPSVVLHIGNALGREQLQSSARQWLKSTTMDVQLVVLLFIDRPPSGQPAQPAHPNPLPTITIEHWKAFPSIHRQKEALMVWHDDWTYEVTPRYYVRLSDLFHPVPIPPVYGDATEAVFLPVDVAHLRASIIRHLQ